MVFWGVEVKPGKPFALQCDFLKSRLHISTATLGYGAAATAQTKLQCNVGNRSPLYICSLSPGMSESSQINLEFDEDDDIIFSIVGPQSIHLCGYYVRSGRNIYINDESPKGRYRCLMEDEPKIDNELPDLPIKDGQRQDQAYHHREVQPPSNDTLPSTKMDAEKKLPDNVLFNLSEEKKLPREVELPSNDTLPSTKMDSEKSRCTKRKKKELNHKDSNSEGDNVDSKYDIKVNNTSKDMPESDNVLLNLSEQKKLPRKGDNSDANQSEDGKINKRKKKCRSRDVPQCRKLSNGLVIEVLEKGKEGGKIAESGKKISVMYTARLGENGKLIGTTAGRSPATFRLGIGVVIEGWDVGLEGMQVGEHRRLIIPPSMGFGDEVPWENFPSNAWLVSDVLLIKVH